MLTETITWHPVADGLPDAELTVNVATESCEEPVWLGCFDGAVWRDTEGMEIKVTHWAEMLRGPAALPAGVTNWSDLSRPEVLDAHIACYAMGIVPPFMPTPAGVAPCDGGKAK